MKNAFRPLLLSLLSSACGAEQGYETTAAEVLSGAPDVVLEWNKTAIDVLVTQLAKPPQAAEVDLSYMHAAIYDAIQSIKRRREPYVAWVPCSSDSNTYAAAAQAGHDVLLALYPEKQAFLDAA